MTTVRDSGTVAAASIKNFIGAGVQGRSTGITADSLSACGAAQPNFVSHKLLKEACTPEEAVALGSLPAAECCAMIWTPAAGYVLHVTPTSFGGATNLTNPGINEHSLLQFDPSCFSSLSMLTRLRLYVCRGATQHARGATQFAEA